VLGMSDARIAALRGMPEGEDGLIAQAVDALFDERRLSPALEAELAAAVGREGVFDLIATVGFYSVLGYILITYDTPIDARVAAEMAERPLAAEG
jgi:4-carboxymuconolactone decarboxylase